MNRELLDHYREQISKFEIQNKTATKGGIVFLGDSLTEQYPLKELFGKPAIANRGISGDTTKGLLKRLDSSVIALKPELVVLLIGTNDFGHFSHQTPENVYERILKTITRIREDLPKTKIYLEAVYPVNQAINPDVVNSRDNQVTRSLNQMLDDIEGVTFLDFSEALSGVSGALSTQFSDDGLHLNQNGYALITDLLKQAIPELN